MHSIVTVILTFASWNQRHRPASEINGLQNISAFLFIFLKKSQVFSSHRKGKRGSGKIFQKCHKSQHQGELGVYLCGSGGLSDLGAQILLKVSGT